MRSIERYKVVIIGSTGGSVFSHVARHSSVQETIFEVASDRSCGLLSVADKIGIPRIELPAKTGNEFSRALLDRYGEAEQLIFLSFYTRLFSSSFVQSCAGRIFNCHPSLLPSFKGLNGFEDTMSSSSKFMGCTLHQVDNGMDTGSCLIQAAYPIDRRLSVEINRHKVFLMQCYTTLQFFKWIIENRLEVDSQGIARVSNVNYKQSIFSPNLDEDLFSFASIDNELAK